MRVIKWITFVAVFVLFLTTSTTGDLEKEHDSQSKDNTNKVIIHTCQLLYRSKTVCIITGMDRKRGSSVVMHLPLVLEVPGSIPASGEENFGVGTRFP